MVLLGPLVLIAIVVAIAYWATRTREPSRVGAPSVRPELAEELTRWASAGLLSEEQSAAILAHEQAVPTYAKAVVPAPLVAARPSRVPPVGEALGYLGGTLAIVGLVLLVAQYWPDLATAGRLALSGGGALVLLGAGMLVRERDDPALARFRWFLWLASTAATGLFVAVLVTDGFGTDHVQTVVLACAGAIALQSGLLWWWRERPLQQLAFLGGVAVFAGAFVAEFAREGAVGLTVWMVGVSFLLLGLWRRTPLALLTEAAGAIAVLVGAGITTNQWPAFGLLFTIATAFVVLALAAVPGLAPTRADQRMFAALAGIALLQGVPGALVYFARGAGVATGLTTWAIGAALVFVGTRRLVRAPVVIQTLGGAAIIGGAALTGVQWPGFAPIFGIVTGIALIALGMLPGQVLLSVFGSLLLLVNVPWAIGWFFPGEGRAPLLILVTGALILGVAVLLTRMGGRFRREVRGPHQGPAPSVLARDNP